MEASYWKNRWKNQETGWHQTEVEPGLIAGFAHLKPTRVLVPLCGKSLDLIWLAEQGHQVVGVELSDLACHDFFSEHSLNYTTTPVGEFTQFQSKNITLWNGDFFQIRPEFLQSFGAIYDRAALIALPPEMRMLYSAYLKYLVRSCAQTPSFEFLQIAIARTPSDRTGPPFSVSESEIRELYQDTFEIQLLSREKISMNEHASAVTEESVYLLKKRT